LKKVESANISEKRSCA